MEQISGGVCAAKGFTAAGVHCGIRKNKDKKMISVEEPGAPIERSSDVLYHVDMDKPGDELDFISVEEYEKYLKSKQLYKEGAKKIVVTGQMADATGLIDTLERVGYNVYPVLSLRRESVRRWRPPQTARGSGRPPR